MTRLQPALRRLIAHTACALAGTIIGTSADAAPRDAAVSGMQRCAALMTDREWLDCIYGAVQPVRGELGLPPALDSQIRAVPPSGPRPASPVLRPTGEPTPPPMPPAREGTFLTDFLGGPSIVKAVPLSAYKFAPDGRFTVTLPDGEVWEQVAGDVAMARWTATASHYVISIRQGSVGGANLQVQNDNKIYKVRRIR